MRWQSRSSTGLKSRIAASSTYTEEHHTSLALRTLIERLKPGRKYTVLDLGQACGGNLDFFSSFSRKIYFEDLYDTISSFDFFSPEDGVSPQQIFRYLLPYEEGTAFDIVFSWDLFNYLEKREFSHLVRHLTRFCRRGTRLFALISTNDTIPEQPGFFRIAGPEKVVYRVSSSVFRKCPQYQESELLRLMPGFRASHSFLLQNGFREYLFDFRPER